MTRHADELGLARGDAAALVDFLCAVGSHQRIHFLWRPMLRDPNDEFIVEAAVAGGCQAIVTHNVADFEGVDRFGLEVLRPGRFLQRLEVRKTGEPR